MSSSIYKRADGMWCIPVTVQVGNELHISLTCSSRNRATLLKDWPRQVRESVEAEAYETSKRIDKSDKVSP